MLNPVRDSGNREKTQKNNISNGVKLLLGGLIIGWGPCLAICAPILLPYIGGTKTGWREGLKTALIFSLGRILSLILLGAMVTIAFRYINQFFPPHRSAYLYLIVAFSMILLGTLIILGKGFRISLGKTIEKAILGSGTKSMLLLGFLIGISPCVPLISVLTYIACIAENIISGILYAVLFGIGTATAPIVLGTLTGIISGKTFRKPLLYKLLQIACGIVLLFFGLQLIYYVWRLLI